MRYFLVVLALIIPLLFSFTRSDDPPVGFAVVELFTSQGCSSCPPADVVLQELEKRARESGQPIYALSFHVDYWNYLGWKDPFSSPHYSARQTDYSARLNARTYTPQMVVNGKVEMIGSRSSQVSAAVERALNTPVKDYGLSFTQEEKGGKIVFSYTTTSEVKDLQAVALLVQDRATSSVKRGENRGKHLSHVAIVRGIAAEKAISGGEISVAVPEGVAVAELSTLLLLQDGEGGEIRAVAVSSIAE